MPKPTFFNLPEAKRNTIIDLAVEEFAANDYDSASISRIVARAGIAKGSLYQYFADKKDLYLYLLDLAMQEKKTFLMSAVPPDPAMGLFPYLRWLFRVGTEFNLARPKLAQVAFRALYGQLPFRDEFIQKVRTASDQYMAFLVQMGIDSGDIDPQLDPGLAAHLMTSVMNDLPRYFETRLGIPPLELMQPGRILQDHPELEAAFDQVVRVLEKGLGPRPKEAKKKR